jgi:hypothetical protein
MILHLRGVTLHIGHGPVRVGDPYGLYLDMREDTAQIIVAGSHDCAATADESAAMLPGFRDCRVTADELAVMLPGFRVRERIMMEAEDPERDAEVKRRGFLSLIFERESAST